MNEPQQDKKPIFAIIAAGGLVALSFVVTVGIGMLPVLTNGRASEDEVAPAIAASSGCCCMSMFLLIGAVVWFVVSRKKSNELPR